ncbi:MAG: hypothetical protein PHH59_01545 [Methylovulum sp.]|uniref:hypothetical protein n=1 Tax=Methylovulum sp. TaxID=1916980 RepID=UPI0026033872|nr:hypothetical protein [Methylovulum sp.]MDD2722692.1 hypothetical protein [Methylovulum sp.]MDD5124231.1 hypothetical protein [Methylovulum sp.]
MKASLYFLMIGIVTTLAACSTQEVKQETVSTPPTEKKPLPSNQDNAAFSGQNPAMTIVKNGKTLNLVRIMDGAACKNKFEGAKGSFLLYADPQDIERIKHDRGAKVFSDFEKKIEAFSEDALQEAVNNTYLAEDPFALGKDEAREKLAKQLAVNFQKAASTAIANFGKETTLTVEVTAFPPSLVFYQQACEAVLDDPDEPVAPDASQTQP